MRKTVSSAILFLLFILLLTGCSGKTKMSKSSDDYIGEHYSSVVREFKKMGFSNIETEEMDDLTTDNLAKKDTIAFISIGGNSDFEKGWTVSTKQEVSIIYHVPKKIAVPLSPENVKAMYYEEAAELFREAEFTNVKTEIEYDRDPDTMTEDHVNSILISYNGNFSKGDLCSFDEPVYIVCHFPYKKYEVIVHIDYKENLIFNRYDVEYNFGWKSSGTLKHGECRDFSFYWGEGTYNLKFSKAGSSSIVSEVELDVCGDVEVTCRIACYSDKIEVDTVDLVYKKDTIEPDTSSEKPIRETILISYQGIDFNMPTYFDTRWDKAQEPSLAYYPSPDDYYATLLFEIGYEETPMSAEAFASYQTPELMQTLLKRSLSDPDEYDLQGFEKIISADLPGCTITGRYKDSTDIFSILYDEADGATIYIRLNYDDKDCSGYDYVEDFKQMLKAAKISDNKRPARPQPSPSPSDSPQVSQEPEQLTRDQVAALLQASMSQGYDKSSAVYYAGNFIISFTLNGMAESLSTLKSLGYDESYPSWIESKNHIMNMYESAKELVDTAGYGRYGIIVQLLNDRDPDNALFQIRDGKITFDCMA